MLEIIAYITLFIDHISKFVPINGKYFKPILGRLGFPIFAFLIAKGLKRTRSREKYIYRLFIFSLVSQIPFILMIYGNVVFGDNIQGFDKVIHILNHYTRSFNVGFTFLISAIMIDLISKQKGNINKIAIFVLSLLIAYVMNVDYGAYGVAMVALFYYIENKTGVTVLFIILNILFVLQGMFENNRFDESYIKLEMFQAWSILALPIIFFVKEFPRKKDKDYRLISLFKYSIYPVHMLLIYIARSLII